MDDARFERGHSSSFNENRLESFMHSASELMDSGEHNILHHSTHHDVRSMRNPQASASMIVKSKSNLPLKRAKTGGIGIEIPGSVTMLSGRNWVTKDEIPNRRENRVNVSETSKAQVMSFAPNGSMMATGHQNNTIQFWDTDSSMATLKYSYSASSPITQIAFSGRRELMATSDN